MKLWSFKVQKALYDFFIAKEYISFKKGKIGMDRYLVLEARVSVVTSIWSTNIIIVSESTVITTHTRQSNKKIDNSIFITNNETDESPSSQKMQQKLDGEEV